jgi:Ca2+-binding EF-hand superfamily protein
MSEFKKAMIDYRVGLNDEELKIAFNTFDKRGDGQIDYEEFLREARVN